MTIFDTNHAARLQMSVGKTEVFTGLNIQGKLTF